MNRKAFLKQVIGAGAAIMWLPTIPVAASSQNSTRKLIPYWYDMVAANDEFVRDLLERGDLANRHGGRSFGYNFAMAAASYACPESKYYGHEEVIDLLQRNLDSLFSNQRPDGTINAGNLESPPDTAFIMEPLCAGIYILTQLHQPVLSDLLLRVRDFVLKVGEALLTGGVHTPNHRWVICHALVRIHQLYPDPRYVNRIDEWLSEGIYIDEDGHYPERSMNYSDVENNAFITMGRLLERPALFDPARKSLEMTYYYMEPNGDLVTFDSRRQDQYGHRSIVGQYLYYRYLAIKEQNSHFAAITALIETLPSFGQIILNEALFHFMENPLLREPLPKSGALPEDFEKVFSTSSLVRIRRGQMTATLFGGVDWPLIIASGRSVSPNFFSYRKGNAILRYLRMSPAFFSMGYFRSEGLHKDEQGYRLFQELQAPYYQPLPKNEQNPDGDYALTPSIDGRFWSKMAFDRRPASNVKRMLTSVTMIEKYGEVELNIHVTGLDGVAVTLEMNFDGHGTLSGVEPAGSKDDYFLASGYGIFSHGGDQIRFGPGMREHNRITGLAGEQYSVHFGSLKGNGKNVYITGYTPFDFQLRFS